MNGPNGNWPNRAERRRQEKLAPRATRRLIHGRHRRPQLKREFHTREVALARYKAQTRHLEYTLAKAYMDTVEPMERMAGAL